MNIGERIKARRKELKVSADKLAKAIGKDRSTIFRYEKGEIENLPLDILEPIAKALHTTPSYLMGWVGEDVEKRNSSIANIVLELRKDDEMISLVEAMLKLAPEQRQVVAALSEDKELYSMLEKVAKLDAEKRKAFKTVLNVFEATEK